MIYTDVIKNKIRDVIVEATPSIGGRITLAEIADRFEELGWDDTEDFSFQEEFSHACAAVLHILSEMRADPNFRMIGEDARGYFVLRSAVSPAIQGT